MPRDFFSGPALSVVLITTAASALAAPRCDALAERIEKASGATFERRSEVFGNVFLRHRAADEFSVVCGPGDSLAVFLAKSGNSLDGFVVLATVAGAALDERAGFDLTKAIIACIKNARRASDEMATVESKYVKVDCQSFARDGGGTAVTLARPDE